MAEKIVLDIFKIPLAINFPRKISNVFAIVRIEGPGGVTINGDIAPGTPTSGPFKIGTGMSFPVTQGAIGIFFQSGSNEDGTPPSVSLGDLPNWNNIRYYPDLGRTGYVSGDVLLAEAIAALPDGVTLNGINGVSIRPLGGQDSNGLKGRWSVEFFYGVDFLPTYIDLFRTSSVIHTVPAPPDHTIPLKPGEVEPPEPVPNSIVFSIKASRSVPDAIANTNRVTVIGYEQTKPTKENPDPAKLAFTDAGSGNIRVEGGDAVFTFSRSEPDLIAYGIEDSHPSSEVVYKFNSKGSIS